jgi:lysophospholipase L1-like esterase
VRIVVFGDSLTQGDLGVNYVEKVAAAFPQHTFINAGVNGDTSLNLFRRVQQDVITREPDGCIIMVGINDVLSLTDPALHVYYRWVKGVRGGQISPTAFRENMRAVLTRLHQAGLRLWVALPPIEQRPEQVVILRQMNDHARQLCLELRIPTLDVMAAFAPDTLPVRPSVKGRQYLRMLSNMLASKERYEALRQRGGYSYSFDGIHLTEGGAQRLADLMIPFLRVNGLT